MLSVRRPGTSLVGPPSSLGVLTSQTLVVPSPFHPLRCRREACGWPRVCGGGGGVLPSCAGAFNFVGRGLVLARRRD